nr:tRNA 2-selenouridine(34) synthase MnmH [Aerococcus sanguinicola]
MVMYESITYQESLNTPDRVFIDVRSEAEYDKDHIPGAISLPVLDNETRAQVGTLYKSGEIPQAKQVGIEAMSQKLPQYFAFLQSCHQDFAKTILYCSRGGFRSSSLAALCYSLGLHIYKLDGGYKSYRHAVIDQLDQILNLVQPITLYGYTGTGKTALLNILHQMGYPVVDLEACAQHKGSLFGDLKNRSHSQKAFESQLLLQLQAAQACQEAPGEFPVFIEGESAHIGHCVLPKKLQEGMKAGKKILIEAPMTRRVEILKADYLKDQVPPQAILDRLNRLRGRLSDQRVDAYIAAFKQGKIDQLIEALCQSYYDPRYRYKAKNMSKHYCNRDTDRCARTIAQDFFPKSRPQ